MVHFPHILPFKSWLDANLGPIIGGHNWTNHWWSQQLLYLFNLGLGLLGNFSRDSPTGCQQLPTAYSKKNTNMVETTDTTHTRPLDTTVTILAWSNVPQRSHVAWIYSPSHFRGISSNIVVSPFPGLSPRVTVLRQQLLLPFASLNPGFHSLGSQPGFGRLLALPWNSRSMSLMNHWFRISI